MNLLLKYIYAIYMVKYRKYKLIQVLCNVMVINGIWIFYWQRAKLLAHTCQEKNKYGVLMIDYRGYGLSEGKPTEDGMYADVDAAFTVVKLNGLSKAD